MAMSSASMTLSPAKLSLGAPVLAEDVGGLPGFANFVYQTRVHTHFNLTTGPVGWETSSPGTLWLHFRPLADGDVTVLRTQIKVQPETARVVVAARCFMGAATTGEVSFFVGASSVALSFTSADNGTEKASSVATATPGWLDVTISIEKVGGAADSYLYSVRCCDEDRVGDYPSPQNE